MSSWGILGFLPIIAIPLLILTGMGFARGSIDGGWHRRYTHKCGFHDRLLGRIREEICPGCGAPVTPADFEIWSARARFPLGWKWGERKP